MTEEKKQKLVKKVDQSQPIKKFMRIYEDEFYIETWAYNIDRFRNGPVDVDIKFKPGAEKELKKRMKEEKQRKKIEKQMKKINERAQKKK